jgi:ribosome biogenesis GTPase A
MCFSIVSIFQFELSRLFWHRSFIQNSNWSQKTQKEKRRKATMKIPPSQTGRGTFFFIQTLLTLTRRHTNRTLTTTSGAFGKWTRVCVRLVVAWCLDMTFWTTRVRLSNFIGTRPSSLVSSSSSSSWRVVKGSHNRFRDGSCFLAHVHQPQQQICHPFSTSKNEPTNKTERSRVPDKRKLLQVAILGPPNAGKSTLFNRLLDKESNKTYRLKSENTRSRKRTSSSPYEAGHAIVSNVPGTTRDCREGIGRIGTCYFWMMDTAGVNGERLEQHVIVANTDKSHQNNRKMVVHHHNDYRNTMVERSSHENGTSSNGDKDERRRMVHSMIQQALLAARQADIIFVMFDARQTGVTSDILEICRWLRKEERGGSSSSGSASGSRGKVFLLANKLENEHHWDFKDSPVHEHLAEAARTGFEVLCISAQHGEGMADIANVIQEMYLERQPQQRQLNGGTGDDTETGDQGQDGDDNAEKPLQLAILGRPNVGKSTCEFAKN